MVAILSYVERGKQPIRELTVSATKYRALVVVRVEAQYQGNRDNKRWRDSLKPILRDYVLSRGSAV